jgi:nicotinamide-nucleotide amidase
MDVASHAMFALAEALGQVCVARSALVAGAESCTGGLIAGAITSVSGSSAWFDRGFVTYSNEAKQELLGVNPATLARYGAVSEETAREMALGALARSRATQSFSVTGVAGPSGGTAAKPVGMVCFGFATQHRSETVTRYFDGDRAGVREQSVRFALTELVKRIEEADERATR